MTQSKRIQAFFDPKTLETIEKYRGSLKPSQYVKKSVDTQLGIDSGRFQLVPIDPIR